MRDKDLYQQILGIRSPWQVTDVDLDVKQETVTVKVELTEGTTLACPDCSSPSPGYDKRTRRWRHLDTCQFQTLLEADVPRVNCPKCGVHQIKVPWAEPGSSFTALFEALVIDWIHEASPQAVSRRLNLSWDCIDTIMQNAIDRGLKRREQKVTGHISIDETSFQKRHEYVTVFGDRETGKVIHVCDDRDTDSILSFYGSLSEEQLRGMKTITMDMWPAYINTTLKVVPDASEKVAFDKFHIAKYLGEAVDKVRREENKELMEIGDTSLKKSKFLWLYNPENMSPDKWDDFKELKERSLRTSKAWAIKETFMTMWHYVSKSWADKAWKSCIKWALKSGLEPIVKVASMIKSHLWGILNAIVNKVDNGMAESINSKIKLLKCRARGFRNRERFRRAIYFYLGGLNLYPECLSV